MTNSVQPILDKVTSNPKQLFLIDGIGGVLTAFLLGVLLPRFEDSFGMPTTILYYLASIACVYAIYSISCSILLANNWRPYLKAIAFANLLYCCITIVLVYYFYEKLTIWGLTYFVLELMVIISLIIIERKAYQQSL
jgi:hypothetical protein